jgi:hypothetical protein
LLPAINDQPSLVFTAAFFKMWLTKLTYHYTPQRVVFEYGCPYTVLAVAIMLSPPVVANTFAKPLVVECDIELLQFAEEFLVKNKIASLESDKRRYSVSIYESQYLFIYCGALMH